MSLITRLVRIDLESADGEAIAGATVEAVLTALETDGLMVVPSSVSGVTDAAGSLLLDLWPNERGVAGSQYRIKARLQTGVLIMSVLCTVPDGDVLTEVPLNSIITEPPYPAVDAALQAVIDAQAQADAAATSAATAATQAALATTNGAAQVTLATTQATNAGTSATNAADSAATATTQAGIATTGAGTATTQAGIATAQAVISTTGATTATTQAGIATAQAVIATTGATTATTQAGIATAQAVISTTGATTATTQAGIATTQATNAATSATNAAASATTATTQAGIATTGAGTATTQAGIATTAAGTATTQAGIATTGAGTATTQASSATTSASTATTQAGIATAQAVIATTGATTATTQAGIAAIQATAAAASAIAAGATIWVSGTTYAVGDARYSPANGQVYRRIIAGAGTTDPSADATNWIAVAGVFSTLTTTGNALIGDAATDTLAVQAGSASLPSIIPTGDTNTGVWFPAADTVAISTGGSERVRASSAGIAVTGALSAAGTTNDGTSLVPIVQSGTGRALQVSRAVSGATRALVNIVQGHATGGADAALDVQQTTTASPAINVTSDGTTSVFKVLGTGAVTAATVKATTGMAVGGATPGTGGLAFPATAVAVADANTLDDYEEGTWTPAITLGGGSVTHTTQTGTYTKVGRLVTVQGLVSVNVATTPSGVLDISGLPFTASAVQKGAVSLMVSGVSASATTWFGYVVNGNAYIRLYTYAAGVLTIPGAYVANSCYFAFTAKYEI